jgi:hypothetical protein
MLEKETIANLRLRNSKSKVFRSKLPRWLEEREKRKVVLHRKKRQKVMTLISVPCNNEFSQ